MTSVMNHFLSGLTDGQFACLLVAMPAIVIGAVFVVGETLVRILPNGDKA